MTDDREPLGRIGWDTYQNWLAEQPRPWPLNQRTSWESATGYHELYMRIGSAVAAQAVVDAGLRNDRRDAQLFALRSHLPAVLKALRNTIADCEHTLTAKPYKAALEALGGREESP